MLMDRERLGAARENRLRAARKLKSCRPDVGGNGAIPPRDVLNAILPSLQMLNTSLSVALQALDEEPARPRPATESARLAEGDGTERSAYQLPSRPAHASIAGWMSRSSRWEPGALRRRAGGRASTWLLPPTFLGPTRGSADRPNERAFDSADAKELRPQGACLRGDGPRSTIVIGES